MIYLRLLIPSRFRCRLGYHHPTEAPFQEHILNPWTKSYTNAACRRCRKQMWMNWPTTEFGKLAHRIEQIL